MASSFVPVTIPVKWTPSRPGSSRSVESVSSSLESQRSHGSWRSGCANGSLSSVPFQSLDPQMPGIQRGFQRYSGVFTNIESSSLQDKWEDRPPTPTLLGYEVMEERTKFTVGNQRVSAFSSEAYKQSRHLCEHFPRIMIRLKHLRLRGSNFLERNNDLKTHGM